jgi:CHAT domain-containing protein
MATLVTQLLASAAPLMEQMAKVAEMAKTHKAEALEALLEPLAEMQAEATQLGLDINAARVSRKHRRKGARLVAKRKARERVKA